MTQEKRLIFSATRMRNTWRSWKAGHSLHEIELAFGQNHESVRFLPAQHDGIISTAGRRSPQALTGTEREDILRMYIWVRDYALRFVEFHSLNHAMCRNAHRPRMLAPELIARLASGSQCELQVRSSK